MKKQFVVIGCGRFGTSIALKLMSMGADVLVVDRNEDIIQGLSGKVTHAVQTDATDEGAIRSLGIRNFDTAIVCIGEDIQSSILVTMLVKELGIRFIVAKAQSETHAKVLYKIGADRVVFAEREMGIRVAKSLMSSNVLDFIELAPEYSVVEIAPLADWVGKTLVALEIRARYGINVMAIKRGMSINITVAADDLIRSGDILVVIGHNDDIAKLEAQ